MNGEGKNNETTIEIQNNDSVSFKPTFGSALFIVLFLLVSMSCSVVFFGGKLVFGVLLAFAVGVLTLTLENCPWKKIEEAMVYGGKTAILPAVVMYCIGAIISIWIACGTIPMLIYLGLKLINPSVFLATGCLACMIISIATGSSWSAIGTVGVALMGISMGLGINPAVTAGAIVSGSYFGDKMSPLSDTTIVASAVAEADIFDHIKAMVYTGGLGIIIALVVYLIMGIGAGGDVSSETVAQIMISLEEAFNLNIITLLPPVLIVVLAIMRKPSIPILLISAAVATLIAIFLQGETIKSVAVLMENGFVSKTGFYEVDRLLSRGGLLSMSYTTIITILVLTYGGVLEKLGVLEVCLDKMKTLTKTVGSLVFTTIIMATILNMTGSQHMSLVLTGKLLKPEYEKKDMLPQTLSRTLEDSGTVTSPLVPWNLGGIFITGTLGVSTLAYIPYAVFNWVVPIIALIYAFTGKFQWKTGEIPSVRTYRPTN